MVAALLLLGVFAAVYFGFAALAMSQDRHWRRLLGDTSCPRRTGVCLRVIGAVLLGIGLVLALQRDGAGFGSLLWVTAVSVGAFAVAATLTWRALLLRPLARLARYIGGGSPPL